MAHRIELNGISHSYGTSKVLNNIQLHVGEGELICFLGPSGCGKTTLLRSIAGFITPATGQIKIGEREVTQLPTNQRRCGLVFQSYALFPHMTVAANVAYGLKVQNLDADQIDSRVQSMLKLVHLESYAGRYPRELSGGQQQRVAIARAVAIEPDVLLLDEPLSNLDAKLREDIRVELRQLVKQTGITTVFVTHDQEEAMAIADRIVVMRSGGIEQVDAPEVLYRRPRTVFVAGFMGQNNLLEVESRGAAANDTQVQVLGSTLDLPQLKDVQNDFKLSVRPDHFKLVPPGSAQAQWQGTVRLATFLGNQVRYEVEVAGKVLKISGTVEAQRPDVGQATGVFVELDKVHPILTDEVEVV